MSKKNTVSYSDTVVGGIPDAEDRLRQLNAACKEALSELKNIKASYDRYFSYVKTLSLLLASFNALTADGRVRIRKPAGGTQYWFLRSLPSVERFGVVPWTWTDSRSDHARFVKGNVFLDEAVADKACNALNIFLNQL